MDISNRVAKNTLILYVRMGITMFASLYSTRLVLSALGQNDFGIYNVVGGAIAMQAFLNAAIASATQRYLSYALGEGDTDKLKIIFNVSVALHFFIAIAILILMETAGYFFFDGILQIHSERMHAAKLVYQFLLVSTFFTIISAPYDGVITAHENMFFVAVLGGVEGAIKVCIAIAVTHSHSDKLILYGQLMAFLIILQLIIRGVYCRKHYAEAHIELTKYFDVKLSKEMLGFAGWNFFYSAASIITMQGVGIVLNSFFGVAVNTAHGLANQVSGQLLAFSSNMLRALNPVIIKSEGANNRNQMIATTITGSKMSFFLFAFFSVPAIVEMPFLLELWLDEVPRFAVDFCRLNILMVLIRQLTVPLSTAIDAVGKIKGYKIAESVLFCSILPLSATEFHYGFEPQYIYINLIGFVVFSSAIRLYYTGRYCNLTPAYYLRNVFSKCLGASVPVFMVSLFIVYVSEPSIYRLTFNMFISWVFCLFLIYKFGLSDLERKQTAKIFQAAAGKLIK